VRNRKITDLHAVNSNIKAIHRMLEIEIALGRLCPLGA
jgi:hypothetical protein